jgi:2-oxoglutarate ferredoxin oxidoreductase subunit alpha
MSSVDVTIEICGMSGDGTIAAGGLLNEAMSRLGFSVMAFDSYPAEIRGFGRCVTRSRIGDQEMLALADRTHILISLDDEQSRSRLTTLVEDAMVFFDNKPPSYVDEGQSIAGHVRPETSLFGAPFGDLARKASGTDRGRNLVALGVFAAVSGLPTWPFHKVVQKKFAPKGEKVLQSNLKSFDGGYEYGLEAFSEQNVSLFSSSGENEEIEDRVLLSGNAAIAKGALDAGLDLYFGYPITPATPIMEMLAKALPEKGGRLMQMEDEISSIGAVLGSFYAGKRAMTATSGPGLALMTELISYGVMAEIPAVIVDAQRGGPSTGLPTKTEQSDLHAAVFGGPGDSPRIVIAPTNITECYEFTLRSFQFAEKYQTPVIMLTDFFLHNRVENIRALQAEADAVKDWNVYPDIQASGTEGEGSYKRFELTESGISPRAIPGMKGVIFTTTGLEHSEAGAPDYSPDTHTEMTEKRYRKINGALHDLYPPEEFSPGGRLSVGVIAWGSTFGAALEAVRRGQEKGLRTGVLKVTSLFPYHAEEIRSFMERCGEIVIPELNFDGQLANLIGHLHRKDVVRINRVTGVPMGASVILSKIEEILVKPGGGNR